MANANVFDHVSYLHTLNKSPGCSSIKSSTTTVVLHTHVVEARVEGVGLEGRVPVSSLFYVLFFLFLLSGGALAGGSWTRGERIELPRGRIRRLPCR